MISLGAHGELRSAPDCPRAASEWVVVEVADTGCGMDPATLERVKEPFFSGFDPPGLGLGLEIARLVATAHGGEVSVSSGLGKGTQVRILIPTGVHYAESGIRT